MTDNKSDIQLDLDALAPPTVQLSYKGKTIEVTTPDVKNYAKIIDFSTQMQQIEKTETSSDFTKVADVYAQIEELIKELIPGLKDETLNFAQLSALFKMLAEIGSPTDQAVEKLKAQGVNIQESKDSPKVSASQKPSVAS